VWFAIVIAGPAEERRDQILVACYLRDGSYNWQLPGKNRLRHGYARPELSRIS